MKKITGIAASDGIAIGKIARARRLDEKIIRHQVPDAAAELTRLAAAKEQALKQLNEIYLNALKRVGEGISMIYQIHLMMLQDGDFFDAIEKTIRRDYVNAEYAVLQAARQFSNQFAEKDDSFMRGRAADVVEISKRIIACLNPTLVQNLSDLTEPSIVAAPELMPSDTVQFDKTKVLAFVTQEGTRNSHSAILARTMGIPAIVGAIEGFDEIQDGCLAIVDGTDGLLILEPDKATLKEYEQKHQELLRAREELEKLRGIRAISKDGVSIQISANIGNPHEVELALENDADGIGLFRSEFLYMGSPDFPTEEVQLAAYKTVLEKMQGKRVIIRTLDLGADKQVSYLNLPWEENPALGYRAIRISLDRKEMFLTQLRALLRASVYGNLAIMFPMITSVEQVQQAKRLVAQAKKELQLQRVPVAEKIELGIMIETPASVVLSDELAKEVDFFSIGTNDLTQYILAVDRMNPSLAEMYDQRHPAVLRMIEQTVKSAKKAGIWAGICGESAADTALTKFYLQIGVSELSLAPSAVLKVRKTVRESIVNQSI